jgi:hypothetical protein
MESIAEFLSSHDLRIGWLPDWATSLIVLALAVLLALWLHRVAYIVLDRAVRAEDLFRARFRRGRERCEVREKMIAFVQQSYPEALPRIRTDLHDERARPRASALLTMSGLGRLCQPRKRGMLHMSGTLFRASVLALREGGLSCQIA